MLISLDVVTRLLKDPNALVAFPFLAQLKSDLDCQTCSGKRRRILSSEFKKIRKRIGEMGESDRTKLKELLGVDRIEVSYVDDTRKNRIIKF